MKTPIKKCKGTGRAKGFGCSGVNFIHRYGLCGKCFYDFLYNSEIGKTILNKTLIKAKKIINKPKKRRYVRWAEKPFSEMVTYVQFEIVNPYIRMRDDIVYGECISSKKRISDAGHFYPTTETRLRFCIQNIHGQNGSDNRYKGGNLIEYEAGIIERFGNDYLLELKKIKKQAAFKPKLDRSELVRVGKTYIHLIDKKIWCFRDIEFQNYKDIVNK